MAQACMAQACMEPATGTYQSLELARWRDNSELGRLGHKEGQGSAPLLGRHLLSAN